MPRQNSPLLSALVLTKRSWMPFMISTVRWRASGSWPIPSPSLPILCQPQEPVQVKIDYFQEGCSSTSNCRTTLLWDGDTLWVNWLGGHYLGYWPTDPAEFEAAIQRLTLEYGGTGTVTS